MQAKLSPREVERLERAAREVFTALGCRDVARIDFRIDAEGRIYFIECNPLPGLSPGWSDLVLIAQAAAEREATARNGNGTPAAGNGATG